MVAIAGGFPGRARTTEARYLLFAAVDLPLFLGGKGKHGFPVLLREVQLVLRGEKNSSHQMLQKQ